MQDVWYIERDYIERSRHKMAKLKNGSRSLQRCIALMCRC